MPITEACMAGIEKNGLRWRHNGPCLKATNRVFAELNNNGIPDKTAAQRLTDASHAAAKAIRSWLNTVEDREVLEDFELRHDDDLGFMEDINTVAECDAGIYDDPQEVLDEINGLLNSIYDSFDYHRILVR